MGRIRRAMISSCVLAGALGLGVFALPGQAEASGCDIEGTVTDADGAPVVGVEVALKEGGLVRRVATDAAGRYRFVAARRAREGFDPAADTVTVAVVLRDAAHEPGHFQLFHDRRGIAFSSDPIRDDSDCRRDFGFADIDDRYPDTSLARERWADAVTLYEAFAAALGLAARKGVGMGPTLEIQAFYGAASPRTTFWVGTPSYAAERPRVPFIGLGVEASRRSDRGRPHNREWHEAGHQVLARLMDGVQPHARGDSQHGGYWNNPTSADSLSEGFAAFWAVMVAKHAANHPQPHWYVVDGAVLDLELDYRAWDLGGLEEVAVAGLLLDLEDGPEDYAGAAWTLLDHEVTQQGEGWVVSGRVRADHRAGTAVDLELLDGAGAVLATLSAVTRADPEQPDALRFAAAVPEGIEPSELRVAPAAPHDDDPIDADLTALLRMVSKYRSTKAQSNGHLFDVDDLYRAAHAELGPEVAEVFVAHGFFEDLDGNGVRDPKERVGPTSHPASTLEVDGTSVTRPKLQPRHRMPLPNALRAAVKVAPGTEILVHARVPATQGRPAADVSWWTTLDADGRLAIVPPAAPISSEGDAGGTVAVLIQSAPSKTPLLVTRLAAATLHRDAETRTEAFRSIEVDLDALAAAATKKAEDSTLDRRFAWVALWSGLGCVVLGLVLLLVGAFRR